MKKSISLVMIVKNEKHVIERCLRSVKNLLDYWVIVDTGSIDGTQEVVKNFLKDLPGELHERPWINFAHNRNEAMQLAKSKADYLLFIDADDYLVFSEEFVLPELKADLYSILQRDGIGNTFRDQHVFLLVKNNGEFEWAGKIHEYLKTTTQRPKSHELIPHVYNKYNSDGNRSKDQSKCLKDIEILKQAIKEDPSGSREIFYLAHTYYSIEEYAESMFWYKKSAEMGEDPIEVYCSLLYVALCQQRLNDDSDEFLNSFSKAHLYRPSRAEAIYEMARYYTEKQNYFLGYTLSRIAISIPLTTDNLLVESWVYDWGAPLYFFICANQIGQNDEAKATLQALLSNPRMPLNLRKSFKLDLWNKHYQNM